MQQLISCFNFDKMDLLDHFLDISATLRTIRQKIENENYIQHLVRKYFINNKNISELRFTPNKKYFTDLLQRE